MENEKCVPLCDENQCGQGEFQNDYITDLKSQQRGGLLFLLVSTFNYLQETLIPRVCALKGLTVLISAMDFDVTVKMVSQKQQKTNAVMKINVKIRENMESEALVVKTRRALINVLNLNVCVTKAG